MNAVGIERLVKQIRREATRNPKKAGILGLLALVAVYFWAPLLTGWAAPANSGATPAPDSAEAGQPMPGPEGVAAPAAAAPATYAWEQLVEWRKQDPLATVAESLPGRRDPFRAAQVKVVKAEAEVEKEKQQEALLALLTPETLGLKLASTVIGPERRVALINGKTHLEGQMVTCRKDGQEIAFQLVEVHPRHVVLEREGRRFELTIRQKSRPDRMELSGSPK